MSLRVRRRISTMTVLPSGKRPRRGFLTLITNPKRKRGLSSSLSLWAGLAAPVSKVKIGKCGVPRKCRLRAPLRVRIETKLGFKMVRFLHSIRAGRGFSNGGGDLRTDLPLSTFAGRAILSHRPTPGFVGLPNSPKR